MPTSALIAPGGSTLGPWVLDDDEAAPGAVIRRPGQPDRRVIGLLDLPEEDRTRERGADRRTNLIRADPHLLVI